MIVDMFVTSQMLIFFPLVRYFYSLFEMASTHKQTFFLDNNILIWGITITISTASDSACTVWVRDQWSQDKCNIPAVEP